MAPTPKLITPVSTLPRINQRRHGIFMWNPLLERKVLAPQPTPDERCGYTPDLVEPAPAAAGGHPERVRQQSEPEARLSLNGLLRPSKLVSGGGSPRHTSWRHCHRNHRWKAVPRALSRGAGAVL